MNDFYDTDDRFEFNEKMADQYIANDFGESMCFAIYDIPEAAEKFDELLKAVVQQGDRYHMVKTESFISAANDLADFVRERFVQRAERKNEYDRHVERNHAALDRAGV